MVPWGRCDPSDPLHLQSQSDQCDPSDPLHPYSLLHQLAPSHRLDLLHQYLLQILVDLVVPVHPHLQEDRLLQWDRAALWDPSHPLHLYWLPLHLDLLLPFHP